MTTLPRPPAVERLLPGPLGRLLIADRRAEAALRRRFVRALADPDGVPAAELDTLRTRAVDHRVGDRDGLGVRVLQMLDERFDDPVARAWLPAALAEAWPVRGLG